MDIEQKYIPVPEDDEEEIDIDALFRELLSHWKIIVLTALICGTAGIGLKVLFVPKTFISSAILRVDEKRNSVSASWNADTSQLGMPYEMQDITSYVEILSTRSVLYDAYGKIQPKNEAYDDFVKRVTVTHSDNSRLIIISVKDIDPTRAQQTVQAICGTATSQEITDKMDVQVISDAYYPEKAEKRGSVKTGLIAAFVSALLVCVYYTICFLRDDTIKTAEEPERLYGLSVLTVFPSKQEKPKQEKTIQSYYQLRNRIMFHSDCPRLITITGYNGNASSTVSYELTRSLAECGKKVLLIDARLRAEADTVSDAKENIAGLSDYLNAVSSFDKICHPNDSDGFDRIFPGSPDSNASNLLSQESFRDLLHKVRDRYDYILIDTWSIDQSQDAVTAGHESDGILLVLASGIVSRMALRNTLNGFNQSEIQVLGCTFSLS